MTNEPTLGDATALPCSTCGCAHTNELQDCVSALKRRVKELEGAIKTHKGYYVHEGVYPNYGSAELDLWKTLNDDT